MANTKRSASMSRMSIYISEANRRRLETVPRGEKTQLVNKALDDVLSDIEKKRNFREFVDEIGKFDRVKVAKSVSEMIAEMREPANTRR